MTTLTYRLAERAVPAPGGRATRSWCPGSTTTPTCGRGCRRPRGRGATVRWAEVDLATGELPAGQYDELLSRAHPAGRGHRGQQRRSAPGPTVADDHRRPRTPSARWSTWTACTPPRTCRWTSRRSAPTSTPPAPTSGPGRTSAPWSPIRRCSTACTRTSSCPPRTAVPGRFERGTPPSPTWPGSSPRWSTWPRSATARTRRRRQAGAGAGLDGRRRGVRDGAVRRAARRAGAMDARDAVRPGRPAGADRVLHRGRPDAPAGRRAPGRARR